jgi:hypothetical protein
VHATRLQSDHLANGAHPLVCAGRPGPGELGQVAQVVGGDAASSVQRPLQNVLHSLHSRVPLEAREAGADVAKEEGHLALLGQRPALHALLAAFLVHPPPGTAPVIHPRPLGVRHLLPV